jgi:hypothetical protein
MSQAADMVEPVIQNLVSCGAQISDRQFPAVKGFIFYPPFRHLYVPEWLQTLSFIE